MAKIEDGKSKNKTIGRGSKRGAGDILNTYDPGAYRVSLHPSKDEDGKINFFYEESLLKHLDSPREGAIQLKQFAPSLAFEASLNEAIIRTHIGVGGEIVRTFPNHRRGTITIHLYSNGDEARCLSDMFTNASNTNIPFHSQKSPIETINVFASLDVTANSTIIKGTNCWLTRTPTFSLSKGASVSTFVFDCDSLQISHGIATLPEPELE